ncbi:MAG: alpha/beta hydrolase family protein [Chloroflexota bacterium]
MQRALVIAIVLGLSMIVGPVSLTTAQGDTDIDRRPVEDALFGLRSVVPADWQDGGPGIYARGTPPADLALIAIQSAAVTSEQVWPSLLPQLALSDIPEVTGAFSSDSFDWTLYRVNVNMPGIEVAVEVAMAEAEGSTYIVLMQSEPSEFEVLRAQVLLPTLEATAPLLPEPTPHPSTFDYQIEEVEFPGGSEGVELAGTLTLPPGPGPHPLVVLMSGSGPQDRDESLRPLTTLKPFALIADALTSAGVGVLRYDDRGVGGSSGDYAAATVSELASDGRAAIDYARSRDDVDPERIGIFGHSEGGLYAAMLGAEDPQIAFIVSMAGPAVNGVDLLVAQNEAILRSSGETEEEIGFAVAFAEATLPLVRDGDVAAIDAISRDYYGGVWDRQSAEQRVVLGARDAFIERSLATQSQAYASDWFPSLLAYDVGTDWERVTVPVLGLLGAKDVQVVLDQNEPALRAALETAGNEDFEIVIFPNGNHLFQEAVTGAVAEYSDLEPAFTPDFLPTIVDWVTARVGLGEQG